jgi:hypothetical protein
VPCPKNRVLPGSSPSIAGRLLATDELNERAWRLRLESESHIGSRVHLAASIAEPRRRFHQDGRELEPRTRDLLHALTRSAENGNDAPAAASLVADLVRRHGEFTGLYAAWRTTVHGRGTHVHITGAPGRWFRVRVQYFPDGTCGFAIDGRFLYCKTRHHPSTTKYSVKLDGQTYLSQLLVGPLTVWDGAPPGVNWNVRPKSP